MSKFKSVDRCSEVSCAQVMTCSDSDESNRGFDSEGVK
jgi:hypothetical protein